MSGAATQARRIRWWWIRHAPTGVPGMIGWRDVPADLTDHDALERRKATLPRQALLLTSDLTRATSTAEALSHSGWTRRPPLANLREQHFGDWEGQDHAAIPAEEADNFWRNPTDNAPPGGESFREVCDRVRAAIVAEHQREAHTEIVVVAHAGVIRAALAYGLDMSPGRALSFAIDPLSLTRMDWFGEERRAEELEQGGGWGIGGVNLPA